ncbi:hypothetical protein [Nostoc sp.]
MFTLDALFWQIDDFCQKFELQWQQNLLTHELKTRKREQATN